jgi:hypothetical protein
MRKVSLGPNGIETTQTLAGHSDARQLIVQAIKVQHFYEMKPYRPENLATHRSLSKYYAANPQAGD